MKINQRFYISLLFIIFSILIDFNGSAFAEYSHFQVGLSSSCSVYESIYKGITCRNASLTDTPVCDDKEDILNSPRRSKLCCCTRVLEEESKNNNVNCLDADCQYLNKESKCEEGFLIHEFEGEGGTGSCCCLPENIPAPSVCTVIGCNKGDSKSGKCLPDEPITSFSIKGSSPLDSPGVFGFGCCCRDGAANKEAVNAITCKQVAGECQEPISTTEPICSSDLKAVNLDIYVKNGLVFTPPPVVQPPLLPPGGQQPTPPPSGSSGPPHSRLSLSNGLDLGTKARTMRCCCKH